MRAGKYWKRSHTTTRPARWLRAPTTGRCEHCGLRRFAARTQPPDKPDQPRAHGDVRALRRAALRRAPGHAHSHARLSGEHSQPHHKEGSRSRPLGNPVAVASTHALAAFSFFFAEAFLATPAHAHTTQAGHARRSRGASPPTRLPPRAEAAAWGARAPRNPPNPASRARARPRALARARPSSHSARLLSPPPDATKKKKERRRKPYPPTLPPSAGRARGVPAARGAAGRRAGAASAAPRVAAPKLSAVEDDMAAPGGRGRRRRARAVTPMRARARACVGPRSRARARESPERPAGRRPTPAIKTHLSRPAPRPAAATTRDTKYFPSNALFCRGHIPPSPSKQKPKAGSFRGLAPRRRARPRLGPPRPPPGWPPRTTPLARRSTSPPPFANRRCPEHDRGGREGSSIEGGTDRDQPKKKKKKEGTIDRWDDQRALEREREGRPMPVFRSAGAWLLFSRLAARAALRCLRVFIPACRPQVSLWLTWAAPKACG